jgi:hypothetical protein
MINRSRKALLSLALAVAFAAALPAAAGAVVVGISDQTPAMFTDPHFTSLKIKQARLVVSWNIMDGHHDGELNATAAWVGTAFKAGVSPLISFGGDNRPGEGNNVPSVGQYSFYVQKFLKRFPTIKQYTAWNEPDWPYRHGVADHPEVAAAYFNQLAFWCHGCTVVAGDFSDLPANQLRPYVKAYAKHLRHKPAAWAIHNYRDVRSHTTNVLKMLSSLTKGPIWLTEISGVERRGHWPYPNQNATAAGRDEAFLFSLPKKFPRIARIYHYQWRDVPSAHWDSGLLGPNGEIRPALNVIAKVTGGQ